MAVLLKRSATTHIPAECAFGCCTTIYGRNVARVRRSIKRASNAAWKRSISNDRA